MKGCLKLFGIIVLLALGISVTAAIFSGGSTSTATRAPAVPEVVLLGSPRAR